MLCTGQRSARASDCCTKYGKQQPCLSEGRAGTRAGQGCASAVAVLRPGRMEAIAIGSAAYLRYAVNDLTLSCILKDLNRKQVVLPTVTVAAGYFVCYYKLLNYYCCLLQMLLLVTTAVMY